MEYPVGASPSLNGQQERCPTDNSNLLHPTDPYPATLPKPLGIFEIGFFRGTRSAKISVSLPKT